MGPESEILRNNYLVIACIKGVVNTGSSTDDKLETWKVTFTSSQVSCENKHTHMVSSFTAFIYMYLLFENPHNIIA